MPVAGLFWYFQTIDWVPKWMRLELPAELLAEKKEYVMRKAREKGYEQWVSGDSEKGAKMLVE